MSKFVPISIRKHIKKNICYIYSLSLSLSQFIYLILS